MRIFEGLEGGKRMPAGLCGTSSTYPRLPPGNPWLWGSGSGFRAVGWPDDFAARGGGALLVFRRRRWQAGKGFLNGGIAYRFKLGGGGFAGVGDVLIKPWRGRAHVLRHEP